MSKVITTHYPIAVENLPSSWASTNLGEILSDTQPGFASGVHNQEGIGIPHLRPMNVDREGKLDLTVVKYVPATNPLRVQVGDVLFNNTNSAELIGKTAYIGTEGELAFSNHMTRLRPAEGVDPRFTAHQLHFLWMTGYFRHRCTHHVNQASIASSTLAETVPFVAAPSNEQRQIVDEIEKQFTRLDAAVAALKRVQANLKRYRSAVLKAACEGRLVPTEDELARREGRSYEPASVLLERILAERRACWQEDRLIEAPPPGKESPNNRRRRKYEEPARLDSSNLASLPRGWFWASLEQLSAVFVDSAHRTPRYGLGGIPALGPRDVVNGVIDLQKTRLVDEAEFAVQTARRVPVADDIIYSRELSLGWAALVPENARICLSQGMCLFRTHESVLSRYLLIVLNGPVGRAQALRGATGSAHPHINLSDIKAYGIPLPPTAEQRRIVAEVERRVSIIEELDLEIHQNLSRGQRLREAVLKQAFEGRLVRQDPNDEPANVLLERILAERKAEKQFLLNRTRRAKEIQHAR